jgi:hypothetical protein
MCGSFFKRGKFAWVQDVRANFVCIHNGELAATVFSTEWEPWQVIIHDAEAGALILRVEAFQNPQDAMSRAEGILDGASDDGYGYFSKLPDRVFARAFGN